MTAGTAACATAAIVASTYLPLTAVAVTVGVLCVAAAIGWPHLLGVPARKSQAAAIGVSALLAVVLAATTQDATPLAWFPAAVALGVGAVFLIQLVRGTGQSHRLESILGACAGVLVVTMGSGWVAVDRLAFDAADSGITLVTGVGVLAAIAVCLLPLPDRIVAPAAVVLAAVAGPLCGLLFTNVPALAAAVIGAGCGAVIAATRRLVVGRSAPLSWIAAISAGVSPVLGLGAIIYFLDRLLLV